LKGDSWSYVGHLGLAQAHLNLGNLWQSLYHLQEAVKVRPEYFLSASPFTCSLKPDQIRLLIPQLSSGGIAYGTAAELEKAILAEALGDRQTAQVAMARFDRQREELERRVSALRSPSNQVALEKAASLWLKNKRYEAATEAYSRLIILSPRSVVFRRGLVQALFENQEYGRAAAALRELLEVVPQEAHAQFLLQRCYERLAFVALEQVVRINANSYRVHQLTAELLLEKQRNREAIEEYKAALAIRPDESTLFFGLGMAYMKEMKLQQAIEQFRESLRFDPYNTEAYHNIGRCYIALHQPEDAIRYLREAIRLDPDLLVAHGVLGRALAMQGKLAEAVREMEIAAPTDKDGSLHYQLYLAYRTLKESVKATSALRISEEIHKLHTEEYYEEVRPVLESGSTPQESNQH
jgi:tetratricopeptide (TPR) repeat protein